MKLGVGAPRLDTDPNQAATIAAIASVNPGGYIRFDMVYQPYDGSTTPPRVAHVVPTDRSHLDDTVDYWAGYDALMSAILAAGLKPLVVVHTVAIATWNEDYQNYVTADDYGDELNYGDAVDFSNVCQRIVDRYSNTANGWPAKWFDAIELWNEPNTPTGNMGGALTASQFVYFITRTASAVKNKIAANWGGVVGGFNVLGPAMGTVDLNWLNALETVKPGWAVGLTHISCHMYPGHDDPTSPGGWPTYPKHPETLADLQNWITSKAYPHTRIAVTEGFYSGKPSFNYEDVANGKSPSNIVDLATQSDYTTRAVQWIRDTSGLPVDFIFASHVFDTGVVYDPDFHNPVTGASEKPFDSLYYRDGQGMVNKTDGSDKPVATNWRKLATGLL